MLILVHLRASGTCQTVINRADIHLIGLGRAFALRLMETALFPHRLSGARIVPFGPSESGDRLVGIGQESRSIPAGRSDTCTQCRSTPPGPGDLQWRFEPHTATTARPRRLLEEIGRVEDGSTSKKWPRFQLASSDSVPRGHGWLAICFCVVSPWPCLTVHEDVAEALPLGEQSGIDRNALKEFLGETIFHAFSTRTMAKYGRDEPMSPRDSG